MASVWGASRCSRMRHLLVDAESGLAADDLPAVEDGDGPGAAMRLPADRGLVGLEPEDRRDVCRGGVVAGQREVDVLIDWHQRRIGASPARSLTASGR